jgi:preprotein translocase subunit YajC
MKNGTKVISNNGHKGEVTEVTENRINIRYESGNETNIHKSKFNKMFKEI